MRVITLTTLSYSLYGCVSDVWLLPQAQDDDRHGDHTAANSKANVSLGLNITALLVLILSWIAAYFILPIVIPVVIIRASVG